MNKEKNRANKKAKAEARKASGGSAVQESSRKRAIKVREVA